MYVTRRHVLPFGLVTAGFAVVALGAALPVAVPGRRQIVGLVNSPRP